MEEIEQKLNQLQIDIKALESSPVFQDYMKVSKILKEGKEIYISIRRKLALHKQLVASLNKPKPMDSAVENDEVYEAPKKRLAPESVKRQMQQNREVSQEREEEINNKVEEKPYDFTKEEMGMGDELELPDLDDESQNP